MLEDKLLVWKFKRGSGNSFRRIYEKYRDDLLKLAVSLLNDTAAAEDIVHDVFASFISNRDKFSLTGSLKGYLATCVANRARNVNRKYKRRQSIISNRSEPLTQNSNSPAQWITCSEDLRLLAGALARLPENQRETITLHLQSEMKFREIAKYHDVPIKTVQSRYRIGMDKLRTLLNSQVEK
ncbi:MAG: sigma-70 family RNA polymerase sigma factor [Sedimentisphaerales bacterium]|nr:sigma-70 family RNA polymerase sigma factor [Sedimentisphaerales bacterium]